MIRYLTFALAATLFYSIAHAQQGNLPTPVQKLPAYPPVVCVAPNWATEPCESRKGVSWIVNWLRAQIAKQPDWQKAPTVCFIDTFEALEFNGDRQLKALKDIVEKLEKKTSSQKEGIGEALGFIAAWSDVNRRIEKLCGGALVAEPVRLKTVLYDEPGGVIPEHWRRWHVLAASGDDVEIRGSCASACTLIMAHIPNDKLCFGEAAALKFHSARLEPSGEPDIATTQWMISQYPQDIRLWIKNKGGWEKMTLVQAWTLTAPDLWAMGYRKCAPEPPPVPMTTKSKARATEEEERERWRKRDEKAEETWRRVNEERAARGER
jgi:hypothetical protein